MAKIAKALDIAIEELKNNMNLKNIPHWLLSGIIIFPVLIVFGVTAYVLTLGKFNALFWLIIPSVIFEDLFETCCYFFSNSQLANLLFVLIFWSVIGATACSITSRIKKYIFTGL